MLSDDAYGGRYLRSSYGELRAAQQMSDNEHYVKLSGCPEGSPLLVPSSWDER